MAKIRNNQSLGLVMPTMEEPWVYLENENDFKSYERENLIQHNQRLRQMEKLRFYQLVFDFLNENRIEGDYHEFGCHRCRTFRMALTEARRRCMENMSFYAYDSFEGLPEVSTEPSQETWKSGALKTAKEDFMNLVREHGIYLDRVHTIEGFYDQSLSVELAESLNSNASIITVDCDLYESALPVFSYIKNIVTDGTVLYIDDYFTGYKGNQRQGVAKAFWESELVRCYELTPFINIGWWGKSFLIHERL